MLIGVVTHKKTDTICAGEGRSVKRAYVDIARVLIEIGAQQKASFFNRSRAHLPFTGKKTDTLRNPNLHSDTLIQARLL